MTLNLNQPDLFVNSSPAEAITSVDDPRTGNPELNQFFTPYWSAKAIVENYFPGLGKNDLVLEPSCGLAAFLNAVPKHVPAIGVEIDPVVADKARKICGRKIITGDFMTVELDAKPTIMLGNPPFSLKLFNAFLDRAYTLLPKGGPVGMIIPSYFLQTAQSVLNYRDKWGLSQDSLPRNIFPGLSKSLVFAIWEKDLTHKFCGFFLYDETVAFQNLADTFKELLSQNTKGIWYGLVETALKCLGGEAGLDQLYKTISPHRPLSNNFWREKVRQTASRHFERVAPGRYCLH